MIWFYNIHVLHSCYWYEKPQPLQNLLAFICLLNFLCCWTAHHWVMRSGRRVGAFIVELYLEKCHIFFQAETCSTFIYFLTTMAYRLLCWTFPSRRVWSKIYLKHRDIWKSLYIENLRTIEYSLKLT